MEISSKQEISEDEFLLNNLPNCAEMFSKTLQNKEMLYYPPVSNQCSFLKIFDFSSQRNANEDDEFISIDTKSTTSTQGKQRGRQTRKSQLNQYSQNQKSKQMAGKNTYIPPQPKFKISQTINPASDWTIIADFNKLTLEKLRLDSETVVKVEDKLLLGRIFHYNEEIEEKTNPFNPLPLKDFDKIKFFGGVTTLDDEKIKTGTEFANVFITDKILSVLMTCVYSSHPWHLKITKLGDNIFFDKMDNSEIDYVTVNESDGIPNEEEQSSINSYRSLSIEATLINEFIKEQLINLEEELKTDGPNPFIEGDMNEESIEHLGYRYRLWSIDDDINVLVRCQVHAYTEKDDDSEEPEFINIFALNEYDKNSYLGKESNLFTLLLKKELSSNHLKLTKWAVNSYIGGVDKIKIAFVTRKNIKENKEHLITGFYEIQTDDLLKITNFNKTIAWGIVKEIVEYVRRQKDEDCGFILMKTQGVTGAKSMLKLYKLPETAFKSGN